MSRSLTARSALIRLASTLPKGSEERKTILAGLRTAQDKPLMAWSYSRMDGDGGKTTNISAEIKVDRRGNVYMEESFHQEDWSGHPDREYTKTERLGTIWDPDIETARDIFREKKGWYANGKRLHSPIRHFQKEMRRLSGRMASMPKGSPERRAILARPNWQSGGSRMDSMTDGFGGEDFFWEGRAAGKPLKMTIEMGHNGMCDLYVHYSGVWLKTKKPYSLRAAKRLAEFVFDALESGETSNPVFLEYRGQEIFSQSRRASAPSGLGKVARDWDFPRSQVDYNGAAKEIANALRRAEGVVKVRLGRDRGMYNGKQVIILGDSYIQRMMQGITEALKPLGYKGYYPDFRGTFKVWGKLDEAISVSAEDGYDLGYEPSGMKKYVLDVRTWPSIGGYAPEPR